MNWKYVRHLAATCLASVGFFVAAAQVQEVPYDEMRLLRLLQNREYAAVTAYLMPFYERDSTNQDVLAQLAYSHRLSNNLPESISFYERLLGLDSTDVRVLSSLGDLSVRRLNYRLAEDYYRRIVDLDPDHVHAHISLSAILMRKGARDAAYAHLAHAFAQQPTNMDLAADWVRMCMDRQEYERADSLLRVVLPMDPDNGRLLYARAETSSHLERHAEVVETCERIIALGAQDVLISRQYAKGLFALKEYSRCLEQYEEVIAMDGNLNELDFYYMAMSAKAMKSYDVALDYMDKALEAAISPNAGFYYGRKADLYRLANQPSNAIATYQKSLGFSVIPIHYYEMALIFDRDLSNPQQAKRYFNLFVRQELAEEDEAYAKYARRRIRELP